MVRFPVDQISGAKQTNLRFTSHDGIPVHDVRQHDFSMTLDTEGFQLATFRSSFHRDAFSTVENFELVKERFFNELEQFVLEKVGGTWAKVYSCDVSEQIISPPLSCGSQGR